jgi:uncharacterized protein (TIRG00374 family)
MVAEQGNPLERIRPWKIVLPIIIGLLVSFWLLMREFNVEAYRQIQWSYQATWWIFMAIVCMVIRDVAYMYRIRVLTNYHLKWRRSFPVIMLWEFASAITPTMIGGTAVAFFIINKEKIRMGRSIAVVLTTAFLDELFFILLVPVIFFLAGTDNLFNSLNPENLQPITLFGQGLIYTFWIGYSILLIYTLMLAYGIFINPRAIKWLLLKVFSLPLIRKWRHRANRTGDDLIIASREMRNQSSGFWIKSFVATVFSWTARYMVVNCIIMAFMINGLLENAIIFARQLVMWIILLVTPTPGASGVAEFLFNQLLNEFIPLHLSPSIALLWRLISYYPYLFIGAILLPRWIRKWIIKS